MSTTPAVPPAPAGSATVDPFIWTDDAAGLALLLGLLCLTLVFLADRFGREDAR